MGSSTGLQLLQQFVDRRGGEAAAHRARAATRERVMMSPSAMHRSRASRKPSRPNYGTSATIPTLDPEIARQLGLPTAEDDDEALARPPRSKTEAFGVKATADALENSDPRRPPEFKGDDGQMDRPPRPEKSEGGVRFEIKSEYEPKGDQPTAIKELVKVEGINRTDYAQAPLGVTGSDTMAKVIEATQRPASSWRRTRRWPRSSTASSASSFRTTRLSISSAITTTTSRKRTSRARMSTLRKNRRLNEEIEKLRLSATRSLFSRRDVLIVASVSCIYGLGSPEDYNNVVVKLRRGERHRRDKVLRHLTDILYERNDMDFNRGKFRVRGDVLEVYPAYEDLAYRIEFFGDEIERIVQVDPLTGEVLGTHAQIDIYPARHFVTEQEKLLKAIVSIEEEFGRTKG